MKSNTQDKKLKSAKAQKASKSDSQAFEIRKTLKIESARFLPLLPKSHPCHHMHGHSFKITVIIRSPLDPATGWTVDYHTIDTKLKKLTAQLDHKILNEVKGLENPTTEILTRWFYEKSNQLLPEICQILISETEDTECRYPIL